MITSCFCHIIWRFSPLFNWKHLNYFPYDWTPYDLFLAVTRKYLKNMLLFQEYAQHGIWVTVICSYIFCSLKGTAIFMAHKCLTTGAATQKKVQFISKYPAHINYFGFWFILYVVTMIYLVCVLSSVHPDRLYIPLRVPSNFTECWAGPPLCAHGVPAATGSKWAAPIQRCAT